MANKETTQSIQEILEKLRAKRFSNILVEELFEKNSIKAVA